MNCCFGGRYGHMSHVGLAPEGREKSSPSPIYILSKEVKILVSQGRIDEALETLKELESHCPKRACEILELIC